MGKYFRKWYQCPKTRNEARQNQGDEYIKKNPWCRAKRRPHNLPDPWDDKPRGYQKNWKKFRKTQYHPDGRGEKHTLFFTDWRDAWALKQYCTEHNIPFHQEEKRSAYRTRKVPVKKGEIIGQKPVYLYKYNRVYNVATGEYEKQRVKTLWFFVPVYSYRVVGHRVVTYYHTQGYTCSWWSDKDIGVEYILQSGNAPYLIR